MPIQFFEGKLTDAEQTRVATGFQEHSRQEAAPEFHKQPVKWIAGEEEVEGVLSAEVLWDWMYLDELWVAAEQRGRGLGTKLVTKAEDWARSKKLEGVWLWTQSWQAAGFYERLGYQEFTRFDHFPRGHQRIGFRKFLQLESET